VPQAANLKTQFGAKGDGVTDDTAALLKALETVSSGAIFLPAGMCLIFVGLHMIVCGGWEGGLPAGLTAVLISTHNAHLLCHCW